MKADYLFNVNEIEYLLQLAKEAKRNLSINISVDGEVNIEYSIPSRSISTYKLSPEEYEGK